MTTADAPPAPGRRISARVRILLWLLLVMAVALAAVATTTRSILLRDVDQRTTELLAQEAGEFANFVERGQDPRTGAPFTEPRRLLKVFLERQYADPYEELLGLVHDAKPPSLVRQKRDIPVRLPLYRDDRALAAIARSDRHTGTLDQDGGEVRWAKVAIRPGGAGPEGTFVVAFHADRGGRDGRRRRAVPGAAGPARPRRHHHPRRRRTHPRRPGLRRAPYPRRLRRLGHLRRRRGRAPGPRRPAARRGRPRTPARRPGPGPARPPGPGRLVPLPGPPAAPRCAPPAAGPWRERGDVRGLRRYDATGQCAAAPRSGTQRPSSVR